MVSEKAVELVRQLRWRVIGTTSSPGKRSRFLENGFGPTSDGFLVGSAIGRSATHPDVAY